MHTQNIPAKDTILVSHISSPLGAMIIGATQQGICLLHFTNEQKWESLVYTLFGRCGTQTAHKENQHINQLKQELGEYFDGQRRIFKVPLCIQGTDFQKRAWLYLKNIPYAHTQSYQQQAQAIGNPKSCRAVGSANGKNKIAIILPCHRVIGKNGALTGYSSGVEKKRWLLRHEQECSQHNHTEVCE